MEQEHPKPDGPEEPFTRFDLPTLPTPGSWAIFQPLITRWYLEENKPLPELQSLLLNRYSLRVTPKMLKSRFKQWGLMKNLSKRNALIGQEQIESLKRKNGDIPENVVVDGQTVSVVKIEKHLKRLKRSDGFGSAQPSRTWPSLDVHDWLLEFMFGFIDEYRNIHGEKIFPEFKEPRSQRRIQDAQTIKEMPLNQVNFLADELSALSVAILQTDLHRHTIHTRKTTRPNSKSRHHESLLISSTEPLLGLSNAAEMLDLEFVLHCTNVYYNNLENSGRLSLEHHRRPLWPQIRQPGNLYANYSVAIMSLNTGKWRSAGKLIARATFEALSLLHRDHPHFLTWICFAVCFPTNTDAQSLVQRLIVKNIREYCSKRVSSNDPLRKLQERLAKSNHEKEICLILLRRVLDIFCTETQNAQIESLELLAKLFDLLDVGDDSVMEQTLAQWANASLSIAEVIEGERSSDEELRERRR